MDLGSGLTFGTRTVDGKVTTGIFFGNKAKASTQRLPIRSTVHPDDDGTMGDEKIEVKEPTATKTLNVRPRNQRTKPKQKVERVQSAMSITSDKSAKVEKKMTTQKIKKTTNEKGDGKVAKKPKPDEKQPMEEPAVNTKYVTLTQGQLTTILSLVKSKNELDISDVLDEKGSVKGSIDGDKSEKVNDAATGDAEDEEETSPTKSDGESKENIANLLEKKKTSPKTKPENKKSKQKLLKEKNEAEPEKDAESSKDEKKNDSSVSKSSFYLGETIPRDGATSAKKRENQQRWRKELEQQREEQRKRKENERTARLRQEDEELWTKHFDTMLPTKASPRVSDNAANVGEFKSSQSDSDLKKQLHQVTKSKSESVNQIVEPEKTNSLRNSVDNSEIGDFTSTFTNTAVPQRSSYLRTMTSLLDPAQLEALEVKRKKQDEHRRAIEAQVAERKQKKAEEGERRRQLEAEEDRRLAAERDFFAQRAEMEKAQQQMQETVREQKTKELYQQMKNAEESALRDKLARRERILRTKGHDTSRLERTHQMTLEMSQKMEQPPLSHRENNPLSLPIANLETSTESQPKDMRAPFAVTAHTEQGPIKLEISLNQKHNGQFVEFGVQTDGRLASEQRMLRIVSDSDEETEYLKLPQKSKPSEKAAKMQNSEKNHHYDKYSRTTTNASKPKRNQPRPKWGVGQKNQTFVPASKRYTLEQQMHDPIVRNRDERLQERRELAKKRQDESERAALEREKRERLQKRYEREFERQKREAQQQQEKSKSHKNNATQRPKSPVVPAVRTRQKELTRRPPKNVIGNHRPSSGIYATTDKAKYRSDRHTSESPVPQTNDFVEYRRTTAVLDPSIPQSRPETGPITSTSEFVQDRKPSGADPLLNPDIVRQHERQDRILREISILRQGLLLKQREVAGYPAAMSQNFQPLAGAVSPTNLILAGGGNLPERTNDTP